MKKIYLAKSNKALIDNLMLLRETLKSHHDVEIIEYLGGGKYSNTPLLNSDCLIVLGAQFPIDKKVNIGKGLSSQISDFPHKSKIYVVSSITGKEIILSKVIKMDHIEQDWQDNYSTCHLYENITLQDALSKINNLSGNQPQINLKDLPEPPSVPEF